MGGNQSISLASSSLVQRSGHVHMEHWNYLVPDLVLYVWCNPETAFARAHSWGGVEKDRLSMSYQTLLHELHEQWLGEGGTCSVPVLCVNTDRGQIDVGTLAKRIVSMLQLGSDSILLCLTFTIILYPLSLPNKTKKDFPRGRLDGLVPCFDKLWVPTCAIWRKLFAFLLHIH